VYDWHNPNSISAYPTIYNDYPYRFNWSGVVPSTTNGRATCVTNDGTPELLPSHPAISADLMPSGMPGDNDKGLIYSAVVDDENCYPWGLLLGLFPDVAAVSVCAPPRPSVCAAPMVALATALFLTQTSTSHEAVHDIQTTSPSLGQLGPSVSAIPTDAVQIKSSESSVSFATPRFSSPSHAAVSSPPAPLLSSTVDLSPASQPQPTPAPSPPHSSPPAPLLSSTIDLPPASQPQPTPAPSPPQSSPLPLGISPSPLSSLSQNVASPPTHSVPLPAPLPTAAPPTSTPLSSSAAGTSLLTQPTQSGTAGLSTVGAGTTTLPIPSLSVFAGPPPIVVGSSTVVANSASQYIILGTTLLPGSTVTIGTGPAATVIALQTSNSETQIIIGTSTSLLAKPSTTEPNIRLPSFTIGTQTITANSLSEYIINGQTLAPGSDLTLGTGSSTTIVALQTYNSQTQLIIGTSTSIIGPPATPPLTSILVPGPITIGTQTITPDSVSRYLVASQTLVPGGPAITVSGTPVSLAPSATAVVVGTSTSGLGGYVWSGIGGGFSTATTSGPAVFTGGTEALLCGRAWALTLGVFCGVVAIL